MIVKIPEHTTYLMLYNKALLGTREAHVWVGNSPDGPLDNDDERVMQERMKQQNRIAGIEAMDIRESAMYPGWYEIDMHDWEPGTYRWNIHSRAGEQAPYGSALRDIRDGEYAWPLISDEILLALPKDQQAFLYLEPNNAGFCIRTTIDGTGTITPAGNGSEWLPDWPIIKERIAAHYQEKMENKNAERQDT